MFLINLATKEIIFWACGGTRNGCFAFTLTTIKVIEKKSIFGGCGGRRAKLAEPPKIRLETRRVMLSKKKIIKVVKRIDNSLYNSLFLKLQEEKWEE